MTNRKQAVSWFGFWLVWQVVLGPAMSGSALGQQEPPVETFVEWQGFPPGAWKRVRVRRETFDEKGRVVSNSTADTTTTLMSIDDQGFTLRAEVVVEVAGRRFSTQPQEVWYGFNSQTKGQTCSTKRLGSEPLEVNGHKLQTQACQVTVREGQLERTIRANCIDAFPEVVRKQSVLVDLSANPPKELDRLTSEVLALDLPHFVGTELKSVAMVRTVVTRPEGRTVTIELHCREVPGRVVAHWSTKWDSQGRVVERSVLELMDYFAGPITDPTRLAPLRRPLLPRHRPTRPN